MRIPCPHCGARALEEFAFLGAADPVRPAPDAPLKDWVDYAYLRDNPAGAHREWWRHAFGCGAWLAVTRDTTTHAILAATSALGGAGPGAGSP